ncbi:unnamed protein product, partial [Musa acuminata subsp. burmannicoides]
MLLEKRPRPPMRRTTSSTEFASSVLFDVEAPQPFDQVAIGVRHLESRWGADWRTTWYTGSMLSPRGGVHRRSSGDFAAPFLRACGLCNRGLGPGRDAYMYRYFHSVTNLLRYKPHLDSLLIGFTSILSIVFETRIWTLHAHVRLSRCRGDIAFCSLECRQQQMNLD